MTRINKVGIELEGGFNTLSRLNNSMGNFHGDGSVDHFDNCAEKGEFVSIPLTVDQIEDFILNNYPTKTNKSCGGHCHVSLKSASDYMDLMSEEFNTFYIEEFKKWGEIMQINPRSAFWNRLNGNEFYCKKKFRAIEQRDSDHTTARYCHINYCYHEKNRHTVEFRMLPCFQKKTLMLSAILKTCEIVENYLENFVKTQKIVSMRIEL